MASPLAVGFYQRNATTLAPRYNSVTFEDVDALAIPHLPGAPARVLDVGAGSGRDAAALDALGFEVIAVEPAAALRRLGKVNAPNAQWVADRLPQLRMLTANEGFSFILCSAVLMSLQPSELKPAFAAMARLLRPSGKLAVTVRDPTPVDADGLLSAHSDEAVRAAAEAADLTVVAFAERAEALGRAHRWRSYEFAPSALANRA